MKKEKIYVYSVDRQSWVGEIPPTQERKNLKLIGRHLPEGVLDEWIEYYIYERRELS